MNHIIECKVLINSNSKISCLPSISDSNDLQDQMYASNTIRENMNTREKLKNYSSPVAHLN